MNNWISAKDKLPERLTCVIGLFKDGCIYVVSQCDWDDVCNSWHYMLQPHTAHCDDFENLTHWMPLPEMPEQE